MLNLGEYRRCGQKLADFLPWAALIAPGVVLNKDGSFQRTLRFRGPDLESATESELVGACARLNNVLKRLGSGWALFFDAERIVAQEYPHSTFPDPASWLVDEERRAAFNGEGKQHFENAYHLTLLFMPAPDNVDRLQRAFLESAEEGPGRNWRDDVARFVAETERVLDLLAGVLREVRALDDSETLTFLHAAISDRRHAVAAPETPMYLDAILADTPFSGGIGPILGKRHLRTLSILGFPNTTRPGLLDALNHLDFTYRWVSRFICLDKTEATKELSKLRRQWFSKRKSITAYLREIMYQEATALVDSDADNKVVDADLALQALGGDHVAFGYLTTTVTVWDEDPARVEDKVRAVERVINGLGFTTIRETVNAVEAWFSSLPGHIYANVRQPLVHTLNLSHIIPLSAVWAGPSRNAHLDGPPLFYAEAAGATPFRFSTHVGDVGHLLIVGPTGAGKSVLLALLALQFRRYPGAQIYIFDKGNSARAAILAMEGSHHVLGAGGTLAFQPLKNIHEAGERSWAAEWIWGLLVHENVQIDPEVKDKVWSALTNLASAPPAERTLTGLSILLQSNALRAALAPYTLEGPYGRLLDAAEDRFAAGDLQCFETEPLLHEESAVLPVLTYLFHRLEARFDGRPTLLILDEAWVYLDNPLFAARIREWLKVLRKRNVSVVFATQSLADIARSTIAPAIIESCPQRIFLPNERAIEPQGREAYDAFGLNARQIELIAKATPKRQYYLQSSAGNRLFELGLSPVTLAFCGASSAADQALITRLQNKSPGGFAEVFLRARGLAWAADLIARTSDVTQEDSMNRRKVIFGLLTGIATGITVAWSLGPAAAIPVFDAAVYSQTLLEASRALTQINNQIQALQNQATMLQNMASNLKKLDYNSVTQMTAALQQVDTLMLQAQGVSYNVNTTNSSFQSLYPQQYASAVTSNQLVMDAKSRWLTSMNTYQQTMSVQSQVVQNVQSDRLLLQDLVTQSQGAEGALQAQQATNQLLALSTKQQLQIQSMMAAQFRAEATEQARAAESQEQGRAATQRFLGSRHAYTPH